MGIPTIHSFLSQLLPSHILQLPVCRAFVSWGSQWRFYWSQGLGLWELGGGFTGYNLENFLGAYGANWSWECVSSKHVSSKAGGISKQWFPCLIIEICYDSWFIPVPWNPEGLLFWPYWSMDYLEHGPWNNLQPAWCLGTIVFNGWSNACGWLGGRTNTGQ